MNWSKLTNISARWIYLIYLAAVVLPFFAPIQLPMRMTTEVKDYIEIIEALPAGSVIWIGTDYDPGGGAECDPQLAATFKHAMDKDLKVILSAMWAYSPDLAQAVITPIAEDAGKVYGVDYVNLGYKPAGGVFLRAATRDIVEAAGNVDHQGIRLDTLPLLKEVTALSKEQVGLVVSIGCGAPGWRDYLNYVNEPTGIPLTAGSAIANVVGQMPFYRSGQLKGILPGLKGGAMYEGWLQEPGLASRQMDAISLGHIMVLIFILIGNIGYFASRRQGGANE